MAGRLEGADDPAMCDYDQRVVLGLLVEHRHATTDDLARMLGGERTATRTDDALAALVRDGLAQRQGGSAWPTRAAVRGD